ncbi:ribosomal protein S18-alanine N-acetyltransferase [Desulfolutivibrio sulfoxidireducens]|uniref:ribosomal protein S18-alanine N-acetyltransferase n=1 Tax=Desulfolutivibrio sulfoxidireducens TaxID=2773299 RepID=UPI001FEB4D0F|nr:ribosomal protein S18-alanine N-acetyltransferase [Desulfolutivibrio sulfoxidireducens]
MFDSRPPERGERHMGALVRLGPDDAGRLAAFERESFPHPWTEGQFRDSLGREHFACYGIAWEGELAAYLSLSLAAGEMEVLNLAVRPRFRRRGLASRLLGHVLQLAHETGMTDAYLEVRASNAPALALYARFGFTCRGRRTAYYPDNREDALLLWRACGEKTTEISEKTGKEYP